MKRITFSSIAILFCLATLATTACERRQPQPSAAHVPVPDTPKKVPKPKTDDPSDPETLRLFDSITPHYVMKRVFDNPKFDSLGYALWQPNYQDQLDFHVSADGKCHTKVDTLLYWNDRNGQRCAAMVFCTPHFGGDRFKHDAYTPGMPLEAGDCHFCGAMIGAALFSSGKDGRWRLYAFEKQIASLGLFGTYTKNKQRGAWISLRQIGDAWTCMVLQDMVGGNNGVLESSERWIAIEEHRLGKPIVMPASPLQQIFDYQWLFSYEGDEKRPPIEQRTEARMIQKEDAYWDIDLITRQASGDSTKHFVFDVQSQRYRRDEQAAKPSH